MSDRSRAPRSVMRFADGLLADELPRLPDDRRRQAVEFVGDRVSVLPSISRFGVLAIGAAIDLIGAIVGRDRTLTSTRRLPIPLVAEYPRLVRSLGYAYVWETWPDTDLTGDPSAIAASVPEPRT